MFKFIFRSNLFIYLFFIVIFGCDNDKSRSMIDNDLNFDASFPLFSDVTKEVGLDYSVSGQDFESWAQVGGGISVSDINNDGFYDIYVTHGINKQGVLFKNINGSSFQDVTVESGIVVGSRAGGSLFHDVDGDGLDDLLVNNLLIASPELSATEKYLYVYKNLGDGKFQEISESIGLLPTNTVASMSAGDIDGDGVMEIAMGPYGLLEEPTSFENFLFDKEEGVWVDISHTLPIPPVNFAFNPSQADITRLYYSQGFVDIDNNGWKDLVVVGAYVNSNLFFNDGNTFVRSSFNFTEETGRGLAIGDYNNDGSLDVFISSSWHENDIFPLGEGHSGNRLYRNNNGIFSDVTDEAGVRIGHYAWGTCFSDFNNDGYLDLFLVNGWGEKMGEIGLDYTVVLEDPALFYINNGDGTFSEITKEVGISHVGQGRGVACFDYDNDGKIDIVIANNNSNPTLYKNLSSNDHNYLHVKLNGPLYNPKGVGARLTVEENGKKQIRELRLGGSFMSNNPVIAYFGVGMANQVDTVKVEWNDGEGNQSVLHDVNTNQIITITHPDIK